MTPTEGGFLRLDKETGAVSFCTVDAGLSVCRVSADERAALENEIARLRRDNAELKAARGPNAPGAAISKGSTASAAFVGAARLPLSARVPAPFDTRQGYRRRAIR